MFLQRTIKIFSATRAIGASIALLFGLNGCSSTSPSPTGKTNATTVSYSSFASSKICADNPFLQKYQCSFVQVEQAARSGDPDAQYALGYLYYYGIGTTQDRQTGLMWIKKAAAQGQAVAQEALKAISAAKKSTVKQSNSTPTTGHAQSSATNNSAQPEKPLTDYLPNYGEKRINTTATPPLVDLSASSPPEPNQ